MDFVLGSDIINENSDELTIILLKDSRDREADEAQHWCT